MLNIGNAASQDRDYKTLHIRLKERADDIINIIESLKWQNIFKKVIFCADSRTKREHLQQLLSEIEQYNRNNRIKIDTVEIVVQDNIFAEDGAENLRSIEIFTNLQSPTKYFKFSASSDQDMDALFQNLATVLRSGTNFNQISILELNIFQNDDHLILGNGFAQFCEYCRNHNEKMLSLLFKNFDLEFQGYKQMIQLIKNSRALTDLEITMSSFLYNHDSSIYDAILNSNLKKLTLSLKMVWSLGVDLIKNSQTIEELVFYVKSAEMSNENIELLREALNTTHTLKSFSLPRLSLQLQQLSFLDQNESLISFMCNMDHQTDSRTTQKINEFMDRNRKLQNERVRAMIVLLYNIARSSHCNNLPMDSDSLTVLPSDIWPLIVTRVKYPGVTLDFGSIAKSIFKDRSIRRVI